MYPALWLRQLTTARWVPSTQDGGKEVLAIFWPLRVEAFEGCVCSLKASLFEDVVRDATGTFSAERPVKPYQDS